MTQNVYLWASRGGVVIRSNSQFDIETAGNSWNTVNIGGVPISRYANEYMEDYNGLKEASRLQKMKVKCWKERIRFREKKSFRENLISGVGKK